MPLGTRRWKLWTKRFNQTKRRTEKVLDDAANTMNEVAAVMRDDRYWTDTRGNIRRMEHKKPLLHNGGKPR